ncbi:MAG: bifunctional 2-polyprenyl-6-hydroxyphenol methylase/3-demethylubiquinol 3-O-methyltransferase UbiG [Burkholderia sp.]|nr:bifunctional 2-polyprenyl-6-hydroxyphenol methylase/3-demethylubiquinol 3-O-methyltransferase UbiG [Burkholderia sp.]
MINCDIQELRKFSNLAHRWWNPNAELKLLHDLNPVRLIWINSHAHLKGKHVIDIGCGGGILSESMANLGAHVKGIDLSTEAINIANLHSYESGIPVDYEVIAAEVFAECNPGVYDVVTCMEMLEHVPYPSKIVKACAVLVKSGGWVFFSTLNRNLKSYIFSVIGAEYIFGLLPKGTHNYIRFIRPSELAGFARVADLNVADIKGITYKPITKKFMLSRDTSINYIIACRRITY